MRIKLCAKACQSNIARHDRIADAQAVQVSPSQLRVGTFDAGDTPDVQATDRSAVHQGALTLIGTVAAIAGNAPTPNYPTCGRPSWLQVFALLLQRPISEGGGSFTPFEDLFPEKITMNLI